MKRSSPSLLLLITLLFALIIGATLSGCTPGGGDQGGEEVPPEQVPREEAPRVGFSAPAFSLTDLKGEAHSLENYQGQALIINFWTAWCRYCVQEMPYLQELHDADTDVVVLAVNVQEKKDVVENFINDAGYTFPVLLDEEGRVSASYLVRGLPTTFAVDAGGVITAVRVGAFDAAGLAALVESTGIK